MFHKENSLCLNRFGEMEGYVGMFPVGSLRDGALMEIMNLQAGVGPVPNTPCDQASRSWEKLLAAARGLGPWTGQAGSGCRDRQPRLRASASEAKMGEEAAPDLLQLAGPHSEVPGCSRQKSKTSQLASDGRSMTLLT